MEKSEIERELERYKKYAASLEKELHDLYNKEEQKLFFEWSVKIDGRKYASGSSTDKSGAFQDVVQFFSNGLEEANKGISVSFVCKQKEGK